MSEAKVQREIKRTAEQAAAGRTVRRHLFLDLEDTVITPVVDGWPNAHLLNIEKVRKFIAEFKPDAVHLFSFAIWNAEEKKQFQTFVQSRLEQALGIILSTIPTVDDEILPACCKVMNLGNDSVSFQEMSDFWGKHEAFRLNMRHMFRHTRTFGNFVHVVLLDDAVINEQFDWPDLQVSGRTINIDTLDRDPSR